MGERISTYRAPNIFSTLLRDLRPLGGSAGSPNHFNASRVFSPNVNVNFDFASRGLQRDMVLRGQISREIQGVAEALFGYYGIGDRTDAIQIAVVPRNRYGEILLWNHLT